MLTTMPEGGSAMDILRSGQVDIAQTGISRSLMELDLGHEDAPLHIAEINSRDGFFLVSCVKAWAAGTGRCSKARPSPPWASRQFHGTPCAPPYSSTTLTWTP